MDRNAFRYVISSFDGNLNGPINNKYLYILIFNIPLSMNEACVTCYDAYFAINIINAVVIIDVVTYYPFSICYCEKKYIILYTFL